MEKQHLGILKKSVLGPGLCVDVIQNLSRSWKLPYCFETVTKKATVLKLLYYLKPDWKLLCFGLFFLVASSVGQACIPFYMGEVLDSILLDTSEAGFRESIIILVGVSLASAIGTALSRYSLFVANRRLNIRIRNVLFAALMKQELAFFDTARIGEITSRLTTDTATMSTALQDNAINFLRHLVKFATIIFFMVRLSWRLSIVIFGCFPVIVIISTLYGKIYMHISQKVQTTLADANNVAAEDFSTMRTVRSFANENGEIERYAKQLGTSYKIYKKQALAYASYNGINIFFDVVMRIAILVYGRQIMTEDGLTGGIFLAFVLYQLQLGKSLNSMSKVYSGLLEAIGACTKIFSYIERKPRMKQNGMLQTEKLAGSVEFDNVSFSYPSRPHEQVLNGISFKVEPGEIVALVGPNGGGKTSCINLLECFYKPSGGRVLLDGIPVHLYEHHYLHKQVSLVEQEPVLYARSVEENIRYGLTDRECPTEKITETSKLTNCDGFISQLQDGYNTLTGEKGLQLSGGQKQRIAIARSLVRYPKVLILDEATSALDAESEQVIQELIYNKNVVRTVLIIAHRLGTVEKADRILVIDKGRVVEEGTHKDLMMRTDGVYAGLVNCQLNKQTDEPDTYITVF